MAGMAHPAANPARSFAQNEPVTLSGAVWALITAILALLVGTDVVDASLVPLILGVISPLIAIVTIIVRSKVTPAWKAEAIEANAREVIAFLEAVDAKRIEDAIRDHPSNRLDG